MSIKFLEQKHIEQDDLRSLYEDAEWYAYTKDLNQLQQALLHSLHVVTAWDQGQLIGLTRLVGDGLTIVYVQDILVLHAYHNQGIATIMMQYVLEKYKDVRQKVLLTEDAPDVRHFYEKNGFQSCDKGTLVAFAKLD
ncbi:GNAT family N-acetyltransferase [Peribacillus muralis]|uniref:GNAT family N-acetyltransferase n=1 Tax=Peribacillus muralis TaxID=264697 RepID=UPI001F4E7C66|nr:GNAT family N-acetyltransferase [Peribacillus muralis]MCK1995187.1 GNAT family N-acetyltransferase [Peribacillus muralis]MCK2015730.1 GNAT family N-acetyltransferase [Peribacillus muralis]